MTRFIRKTKEDKNKLVSLLDLGFDGEYGYLTIWEYPNDFEKLIAENNSDEPSKAEMVMTVFQLERLKDEIDIIIKTIKKTKIESRKEFSDFMKHTENRDNEFKRSYSEDDELDDDLKKYFSDNPDNRE